MNKLNQQRGALELFITKARPDGYGCITMAKIYAIIRERLLNVAFVSPAGMTGCKLALAEVTDIDAICQDIVWLKIETALGIFPNIPPEFGPNPVPLPLGPWTGGVQQHVTFPPVGVVQRAGNEFTKCDDEGCPHFGEPHSHPVAPGVDERKNIEKVEAELAAEALAEARKDEGTARRGSIRAQAKAVMAEIDKSILDGYVERQSRQAIKTAFDDGFAEGWGKRSLGISKLSAGDHNVPFSEDFAPDWIDPRTSKGYKFREATERRQEFEGSRAYEASLTNVGYPRQPGEEWLEAQRFNTRADPAGSEFVPSLRWRMSFAVGEARYEVANRVERFWINAARRVPRMLAVWVVIHAVNKASGNGAPDSVNGVDILKAMER